MYWHKNGNFCAVKGFSLQINNISNQIKTKLYNYLLSIPLDKTLQRRTAVQVPITCSKQIVLNTTKHER